MWRLGRSEVKNILAGQGHVGSTSCPWITFYFFCSAYKGLYCASHGELKKLPQEILYPIISFCLNNFHDSAFQHLELVDPPILKGLCTRQIF